MPEVDTFRTGRHTRRPRSGARRRGSPSASTPPSRPSSSTAPTWPAARPGTRVSASPKRSASWSGRRPLPNARLFRKTIASMPARCRPGSARWARSSKAMTGVIVIGAPVFRYYSLCRRRLCAEGHPPPAGDGRSEHVVEGPDRRQPGLGRRALPRRDPAAGDEASLVGIRAARAAPKTDMNAQPLAGDAIMAAVRDACPADYVLVEEAPSVVPEMQDQFRIDKPDCLLHFRLRRPGLGHAGRGRSRAGGALAAAAIAGRCPDGRRLVPVFCQGALYTAVQARGCRVRGPAEP